MTIFNSFLQKYEVAIQFLWIPLCNELRPQAPILWVLERVRLLNSVGTK